MTRNAIQRVLAAGVQRRDRTHDGLMAVQAVVQHDIAADRSHFNGFLEVHQGERSGVRIAILELGGVLAEEIVGHMATVAGRHGFVRTVRPTVILIAHDVAVHAGLGIIEEIGPALGVGKRVGPHPGQDAGQGKYGDEKRKTKSGRALLGRAGWAFDSHDVLQAILRAMRPSGDPDLGDYSRILSERSCFGARSTWLLLSHLPRAHNASAPVSGLQFKTGKSENRRR